MRTAWQAALYGPGGFYRIEQPADHFRTSTHVSPHFAGAVLSIAREHAVATIVDVGAGAGELLTAIRGHDSEIDLVAVEVRPAPSALPRGIEWRMTEGDGVETVAALSAGPILLVANELLDNIPCDVVELTDDGLRVVEVHLPTGRERLGGPPDPAAVAWIERWWPVDAPRQRAVVGLARDAAWAQLCASVSDGVCIAIDYGHLLRDRPPTESPTSYRHGRQTSARFDGRHDVTAPVAFDSVASVVGGRVARQRDVLTQRLARPDRPAVDLATADPIDYLRRLSSAGDWRELTASDGLGGFWWIETPCGLRDVAATMGAESEVAR